MSPDYKTIKEQLEASGQGHLLEGYDRLDASSQVGLLEALSRISWQDLPALIEQHVTAQAGEVPRPELSPAEVTIADPELATELASRGEDIIRSGRVAAFTVAGGQGTRLGWGGPKGTFPATPVNGKPLFRVFAEQIEAASRRWDTPIRWYIMTSEANDAATRSFLAMGGMACYSGWVGKRSTTPYACMRRSSTSFTRHHRCVPSRRSLTCASRMISSRA